jgi:hypothetical protein
MDVFEQWLNTFWESSVKQRTELTHKKTVRMRLFFLLLL